MKVKSSILLIIVSVFLFVSCSDEGEVFSPPDDNRAIITPPIPTVKTVNQKFAIASYNLPAESVNWRYAKGSSCGNYSDYSASLTLQMLSYMGKADVGETPNAYFCAYVHLKNDGSPTDITFQIYAYDNTSSILYSSSMSCTDCSGTNAISYLKYTYNNTISEMLYWIKKKPTQSLNGYVNIAYDNSSTITIK